MKWKSVLSDRCDKSIHGSDIEVDTAFCPAYFHCTCVKCYELAHASSKYLEYRFDCELRELNNEKGLNQCINYRQMTEKTHGYSYMSKCC